MHCKRECRGMDGCNKEHSSTHTHNRKSHTSPVRGSRGVPNFAAGTVPLNTGHYWQWNAEQAQETNWGARGGKTQAQPVAA